MKRYSVNKSKAAHAFRKSVSGTKVVNMVRSPMRGGWRL